MAATDSPLTTASASTTYKVSKSIEDLRARAQSHLQEIEQELAEEHTDRLARDLQLQLYTKQPRRQSPPQHQLRHQGIKSTSRSHSTSHQQVETPLEPSPPSENKLPRLRTAQDVLNRLQHDPSLQLSERCEYVIGYLERFNGIMEMPVTSWIRESTDEDFIPQHRIRYITRRRPGDDEVVWSRDDKVDKIFGSGMGN